jgi:hypothetical protein
LGAGGHTKGAAGLVGVVMEAMRAERRHEVVADMDGSRQAGLVSIKVTRGFNFFYQKKKNGLPLFLFIFFLYFFLLCVWLGYLFFRARHNASLAKREVAMDVLLGALFI